MTAVDDTPAATAAVAVAESVRLELASRRAVLSGLSELVDRLGRSPGSAGTSAQGVATLSGHSTPASLRSVTAFQSTWSRLRAEQRLRQALDHVPANSGPLNSSQVMNRTLQALYNVSPAYLDAFVRHVDTLLWLERK